MEIDDQWKAVERCYRLLQDESHDGPIFASLRESWALLESDYHYAGKPLFERGEALRKNSGSPLSLLFYSIDMGFYPPPEVLLALSDCWEEYLRGQGTIDLESVFLGKPRQRAGNAAKRSAKRSRDFRITWRFAELLRAGVSRETAAEKITQEMPDAPDADSILRMLRGFTGFGPGKQKVR